MAVVLSAITFTYMMTLETDRRQVTLHVFTLHMFLRLPPSTHQRSICKILHELMALLRTEFKQCIGLEGMWTSGVFFNYNNAWSWSWNRKVERFF